MNEYIYLYVYVYPLHKDLRNPLNLQGRYDPPVILVHSCHAVRDRFHQLSDGQLLI